MLGLARIVFTVAGAGRTGGVRRRRSRPPRRTCAPAGERYRPCAIMIGRGGRRRARSKERLAG